jgi:hypothetical protein
MLANTSAARAAEPQAKPSFKPIQVEGEVVDTWCWNSGTMGEGRGEKHHACGLACVMGGVSGGIVDDKDNLYIAAKTTDAKGAKELLTPYVAHRVRVKGWVAETPGCRLIKIAEIKDLGPAEKPEKDTKR